VNRARLLSDAQEAEAQLTSLRRKARAAAEEAEERRRLAEAHAGGPFDPRAQGLQAAADFHAARARQAIERLRAAEARAAVVRLAAFSPRERPCA
jgi:hypothetical protein